MMHAISDDAEPNQRPAHLHHLHIAERDQELRRDGFQQQQIELATLHIAGDRAEAGIEPELDHELDRVDNAEQHQDLVEAPTADTVDLLEHRPQQQQRRADAKPLGGEARENARTILQLRLHRRAHEDADQLEVSPHLRPPRRNSGAVPHARP